MSNLKTQLWLSLVLLALSFGVSASGFEGGIPEGWSCEGRCGVAEADGVISLAPAGGSRYGWVSSNGSGVRGLGLPGIGGTNGSRLRSAVFSAEAGADVQFHFNYVTSDGAGFADYAWARLLDASHNQVALLFTARTTTGASTVPGFNMPPVEATITPESVSIVRGGPRWSPLGGSSGRCYSTGCGYTGWVQSNYVIPASGDYILEFGVVNWSDTAYDSGMAFDGILVGGKPIGEADYRDVVVTARIARDDIELHPDSFVTPPIRIEERADWLEVEWSFDGFSAGDLAELDFDIELRNPQPGENRLVIQEVFIRYNDLAGQDHQRVLDPQYVAVLPSAFTIDVATDRPVYGPDETVAVSALAGNLSEFEAAATAVLSVQDAVGTHVADLATLADLSLAAGSEAALPPAQFLTGRTYTGEYRVLARLLDANGELVAEAAVPFEIQHLGDAAVSARVATDKPEYAPGETVAVHDRVSNLAVNSALDGLTARTVITGPDGAAVWSEAADVPQLSPEALYDLDYSVSLGQRAAPGNYQVTLEIEDEAGLRATASAQFNVRSTDMLGEGLAGLVGAAPQPVLKSESLALVASIHNDGNSDLRNLPVHLRVVDPATEEVLAQWQETLAELDVDARHHLLRSWKAWIEPGSTVGVVLTAQVGGVERVLATTTVQVQEKLEAELALKGRGRLLILHDDGKTGGSCQRPTELDLAFRPGGVLLPSDRLLIELFHGDEVLLDTESLTVGDVEGGWNQNLGSGVDLAVVRVSADGVDLSLTAPAQAALADDYQLRVTHWQADEPISYASGPIDTDCDALVEGTTFGAFTVKHVLGPDAADPYGPDGAPTLLTQRRFLEQLLDRQGWSYTIVSSAEAFEEQLRTGDYRVFGLFHEQVKLAESVQSELVRAIEAGAGLLYAGYHDQRNGRIEPALGVSVRGKLPQVDAVAVEPSPLHADGAQLPLTFEGRTLRAIENGADVLARYHPAPQQDGEVAIASQRYGDGSSVYMGFDVLAQATAHGEESDFATLIVEALGHVHPEQLLAESGRVLPLTFSLQNRGQAVAGAVVLRLPEQVSVVDAGGGRLQGDHRLMWPYEIESDQTQEWAFWLRTPQGLPALVVDGHLYIDDGEGSLVEYGPVVLELLLSGQ